MKLKGRLKAISTQIALVKIGWGNVNKTEDRQRHHVVFHWTSERTGRTTGMGHPIQFPSLRHKVLKGAPCPWEEEFNLYEQWSLFRNTWITTVIVNYCWWFIPYCFSVELGSRIIFVLIRPLDVNKRTHAYYRGEPFGAIRSPCVGYVELNKPLTPIEGLLE